MNQNYNLIPQSTDITHFEKGCIEQIAFRFFNVAEQPSRWYAGVTQNLESSLIKHKAYGSDFTSINMDEKKYATYLKSLLINKFGFEGTNKGFVTDKSTIVYIYKKN